MTRKLKHTHHAKTISRTDIKAASPKPNGVAYLLFLMPDNMDPEPSSGDIGRAW